MTQTERAGMHLLVDLWGVEPRLLGDEEFNRITLERAATDAGATVLTSSFHHFGENYGVSGVVLLAESHISIHTWPERDLATIDIYMCGKCDPSDSLPTILAGYNPTSHTVQRHHRGVQETTLLGRLKQQLRSTLMEWLR